MTVSELIEGLKRCNPDAHVRMAHSLEKCVCIIPGEVFVMLEFDDIRE